MYTLAYGTDASFYRLIPKMVIKAKDEQEVSLILSECYRLEIPVTFRAAGTSLSGQSVTDSVLIVAGNGWTKRDIYDNGDYIKLQPGLIGGHVNKLLAPYGKKIGPDPASINAAMIGGIAANNASGMCCGTSANSYNTTAGMRIVFADGSVLDTSDKNSREFFSREHEKIISDISRLAKEVKENQTLSERIRKKYKIKNTTGFSLNALTDFTDPFDIIEHLMIGSEGTLGFISEITYKTVNELPFKASSLMLFPDIRAACLATIILKQTPAQAVELIDRAALRSVENEHGIPKVIKSLDEHACALLVETAALCNEKLNENINAIKSSLASVPTLFGIEFTSIAAEYELLWNIRKGLFPSVGAMRKSGTTVIIEDVAFPIECLADSAIDLRAILDKHKYDEAVIFGHALDGNLHFVFTQDFTSTSEIERYDKMMAEVSELVVKKYDGSLKAEHGTGRNMAPFVELEWGKEAYLLMKEIKQIFDPKGILNPGVILNDDASAHLKNLKPLPIADDIIDKCIECGFCEPSCVSADLTLSPRQRIAVYREIQSLTDSEKEPHIAASLVKAYKYSGDATCATDGLCAMNCPVKIDTGKLVKRIRKRNIRGNEKIALWLANNMNFVTATMRVGLKKVSFFHSILGTTLFTALTSFLRTISFKTIPKWNKYMPSGAKKINTKQDKTTDCANKVVYFPSCINRAMGVSKDHKNEKQLSETLVKLIKKGGFEIIWPQNMDNLCCGMAFLSKGYTKAGEKKSAELGEALLKASENGKYPIICDMSPCFYTMKENLSDDLKIYEPVEFILKFLIPNLIVEPIDETISVFPVCSMKKLGLDGKLVELARMCSTKVVVSDANCCGFAGDRGFSVPELNEHGLRHLKQQLCDGDVKHGYSTSRTCEIGFSQHSGISHKSIVYLVDKVTKKLK